MAPLADHIRKPLPYGVRVYPGVVNLDLCAHLISHFEAQPKREYGELLYGARPTFAALDIDERDHHPSPEIRITLREIRKRIDTYLDEFIALPELRAQMRAGCFSLEPRMKRYDVGAHFPLHADGSSISAMTRQLAYILYLNDDFDGGQTVFRSGTEELAAVQPVAGAMLVFPVHCVYMHEGMSVGRGSKYILNGFADIFLTQARATTPEGLPVSKLEAVTDEIRFLASRLLDAARNIFQ